MCVFFLPSNHFARQNLRRTGRKYRWTENNWLICRVCRVQNLPTSNVELYPITALYSRQILSTNSINRFYLVVNGAPFSYRNRKPHLHGFFLLRFIKWVLRAYKYRQLRPWLARNGSETCRYLYNTKKTG